MIKCKHTNNIKYIFLVKKGMATKAMVNNLNTGNNDRLKKQIANGTVKVYIP